MDTQNPVKSKNLKLVLAIIGVLFLIFASFASGVAVGLRKAKFSYQWGQNYERNFMGGMKNFSPFERDGRGGMMDFSKMMEGRDFRNAHGLSGTIISIVDNNLIVKDRDNQENTVAVTERTVIKDHFVDVKMADLKVNDQIVIIGRPDEKGVINAELIRVFCCNEAVEPDNKNDNN